jgi:SAM-dependent methyltransferase
MEIRTLNHALTFEEESGIWTARQRREVSYPDDGNDACFALEDSSFWFRHRNRCIVAAVRRYPPPGPILDVGGGNGYVTRGLLDAGFESVLLEPGRVGALNARTKRGVHDVLCATLEDCAFEAGTLPAIGLFDVLEHIEDDGAFMNLLQQILEPRGLLYITVPAHRCLWSASDVDARHYRRYNTRQLISKLSPGFDVLYSTYLFQTLALPCYLKRTLPFRLGWQRRRAMADYASEHSVGERGGLHGLLNVLLGRELKAIESGRSLKLGTSCLLVARKRLN